MLAICSPSRNNAAWPFSVTGPVENGDDAAPRVWIGTMIVVPNTVTALWSVGPAPPLREGAVASA